MPEKQVAKVNHGNPPSEPIHLINSGPLMNAERPAHPPMPRGKKMREAREILDMVLDSPVIGGKYYEMDGTLDLATIIQLNTTSRTRIMLQLVTDAMNGKPEAIKMIANIEGWNAPAKTDISISRPVFIEDIPRPADADIIDVTPEKPVTRVNGRIVEETKDE